MCTETSFIYYPQKKHSAQCDCLFSKHYIHNHFIPGIILDQPQSLAFPPPWCGRKSQCHKESSCLLQCLWPQFSSQTDSRFHFWIKEKLFTRISVIKYYMKYKWYELLVNHQWLFLCQDYTWRASSQSTRC